MDIDASIGLRNNIAGEWVSRYPRPVKAAFEQQHAHFVLSTRFGVATSNINCYLMETAQGKQNINKSILGFLLTLFIFKMSVVRISLANIYAHVFTVNRNLFCCFIVPWK